MDGKNEEEAEVCDSLSQPLFPVRPAERILSRLWLVQNLLQESGFKGRNSRSDKVQLVTRECVRMICECVRILDHKFIMAKGNNFRGDPEI